MLPVATYDGGKVTKSEYAIYYKTFQPMLTYFGYSDDIIPEQIANKAALDEIILKEAKKKELRSLKIEKKKLMSNFKIKSSYLNLKNKK